MKDTTDLANISQPIDELIEIDRKIARRLERLGVVVFILALAAAAAAASF